MRWLYTFAVHVYGLLIRLSATCGNRKARLWVKGRKQEWKTLERKNKVVWMHVSSLGEFEQGRPVLERMKGLYPNATLLLTFFSPSGYEVRKNYAMADRIIYLPLDVPKQVKAFLDFFSPDVAIFVKYDFWYNFIWELHKRGIPLFYISVSLRPSQVFFKWYGGFFRKHLRCVTYFFAQREQTCKLLRSIGIENCTAVGDTRFDRVVAVANQHQRWGILDRFTAGHRVYVGGSTWLEDEKYIARALELLPEVKFIVVPHEVTEQRLAQIEALMPGKTIRFSSCSEQTTVFPQVLIIDKIGMLSSLYSYATIAHVGNGFGSGIHNTLEAAVYGIPVIFGPNYQKFPEAVELIQLGAAFSFNSLETYETLLKKLFYEEDVETVGKKAKEYVLSNTGATERILQALTPYLS